MSSPTGATITAVTKVVVAVLIGAVTSQHIPNRITTVKDLSFIVSSVCVPCMLVTHLTESCSIELLQQSFLLPLFSLLNMAFGAGVSWVYSLVVLPESKFPGYKYLTILGSTFQNSVIVPLSLATSLKGSFAWFGPKEFKQAVAYIFVYYVMVTIIMWSLGNAIIQHAKEKLARRANAPPNPPLSTYSALRAVVLSLWNPPFVATLIGIMCGLNAPLREQLISGNLAVLYGAMDIVGQGTIPAALVLLGSNLSDDAPPKPSSHEAALPATTNQTTTAPTEQKDCCSQKENAEKSCGTVPAETRTEAQPPVEGKETAAKSDQPEGLSPSAVENRHESDSKAADGTPQSPSPMSPISMNAAIAAVCPPQGAAVLAKPSPPPAASSTPDLPALADPFPPIRAGCAVALPLHDNSLQGFDRIKSLFAVRGIPLRFILGVCFLRLVLTPAVCFLLIIYVVLPHYAARELSLTLQLVLFLEGCAPTAIITALMCNVHDVMPREYAKMVFYEYVLSLATTTGWLIITLTYLTSRAAELEAKR